MAINGLIINMAIIIMAYGYQRVNNYLVMRLFLFFCDGAVIYAVVIGYRVTLYYTGRGSTWQIIGPAFSVAMVTKPAEEAVS